MEEAVLAHHAATVRSDVREQLRMYEDPVPVPILEFIESDRYLNLKEYAFPACKWILHTFYNPRECYDNFVTKWNGETFEYPGFGEMGYSKEEVDNFYFNRLIAMIGMRFGKSVLSAIGILYETYKLLCMEEPTHGDMWHLAPGTRITISLGATTLDQSEGTVYAYVNEWRDSSPWFQRYIDACRRLKINGNDVYHQTALEFHWAHKNIQINAVHANSSALRGRTRKAVVLDEIAHFDDGHKKNAQNMWDAMVNSTKSFGDGSVVYAISSPVHIADMINQLYAQCAVKFEDPIYEEQGWQPLAEFSQNQDPRFLGFHYPTWALNPQLPYKSFINDFKSNPEGSKRDFLAMPSQAEEAFFTNPLLIDEMFDERISPVDDMGRLDPKFRPKAGRFDYYMHVDVGSGKPSNFGIAIGHMESIVDPETKETVRHIYIDFAHAIKPSKVTGEMDFEQARVLIRELLDRFPNVYYSSDMWQDAEFSAAIRRKVRKVSQLVVDKEQYDELKNYVYSRTIKCHQMPLLSDELKRLELINGKKVAKGVNFTKDVADCVAAVAYNCVERGVKRLPVGRNITGLMAR
jgi:hypothetical protein